MQELNSVLYATLSYLVDWFVFVPPGAFMYIRERYQFKG